MTVRLLVVVMLLVLFAVAPLLWRRRQRAIAAGPADHPPVPRALLDGADRTWVLFTTPWCASCGPVERRLRASDPEARLVTVDATREPELAGALAVRSAPTALLADRDGRVQARLVGVAAVDRYVTVTP
ncbi:MAG: thioredoxin family protein [Acidimicrobiales bacterium]